MRGVEDQKLIDIARKLRKLQTPWESKLWYLLRDKRLKDVKFRRQYPIGKYVVDFCCISKKLVLEIDGSHHNRIENKVKDADRDSFIESRGYKILRIWNNDLENNLEGVLQEINKFLKV